MNQIACPSEEQLRDYILGKLPEDVADPVNQAAALYDWATQPERK